MELLNEIKEEIEKKFDIIKFEDEIEDGNGFAISFKSRTINMMSEDIEKIIAWKEELEEEFEMIELEIEADSEYESILINLGGC